MTEPDSVNLPGLPGAAKCFAFVRQQWWPEGVRCPSLQQRCTHGDRHDDTQRAHSRVRSRSSSGVERACGGHSTPLRPSRSRRSGSGTAGSRPGRIGSRSRAGDSPSPDKPCRGSGTPDGARLERGPARRSSPSRHRPGAACPRPGSARLARSARSPGLAICRMSVLCSSPSAPRLTVSRSRPCRLHLNGETARR
jgi:hypothetical protein